MTNEYIFTGKVLKSELLYEYTIHRNDGESLQDWLGTDYITLQTALFDDSGVDGIMATFLNYVKSLGIEPQELEQAYYDKNKINYERLENGY